MLINQWHGYIWNLGRVDDEFVEGFYDVFRAEFNKFYENNELSKYFYRHVSKEKLALLLNNKESFLKYVRERKGKSLFKKALICLKEFFNK